MSLAVPTMTMRQSGKLALWLATAIVLTYLLQDYGLGGNAYKQGDWLINIEQAFVRRGILGSALLHLSDALHVDLLLLVVLGQASLLLLLAGCLARVMAKVGDQPLFLLLLFSPAFVILFWANDPQGSLRKELFAYAAFGLVLFALAGTTSARGAAEGATRSEAVGHARGLLIGATALFAVGMIAHEANLLFLPAFAWLLYGAHRTSLLSRRDLVLTLILLIAVAALSAAFFLAHVSLANAAPVCAPLLARGLRQAFCDGAIAWVTRDLHYAILVTANNWSLASWGFWTVYGATTVLAFWFSAHFVQHKRLLLMYVVTALPFLPLFYVALDWGRWMNFHVSTWTFLVLADYLTGRLQQTRLCDDKLLLVLLSSVLPLAPSHMTYLVLPRAVLIIAAAVILMRLADMVWMRWQRLTERKSLAPQTLSGIEKS